MHPLPQNFPFHRGSVQASLETIVTDADSGWSRDDDEVDKVHNASPEQVYPEGQQDDTGDFTSHV